MNILRFVALSCISLWMCSSARGADILFMYQPNNPDFDEQLVEFIESLGHSVTLLDTTIADGDMQMEEASNHDLVYVTESLGSDTTHDGVETHIKEIATPQIWAEAYAWDEAALTGDVQFVDFGNTQRVNPDEDPVEEFNEGQTSMFIKDPNHPLAGGFSDVVQVYEEPYSLNWGFTETLGPGANVIASVDEAGEYASLFVYEQGAELEDGTPAAGMRIATWVGQAGFTAPFFDYLHPDGLKMIEVAIAYALGETATVPGDFNDDGVLDATDIDDLTAQSAAGTNPAAYDLNGDALVNQADVNVWAKQLFGTWVGDADLNSQFNSSDLVAVLASGTYEADIDAVWSTGDFNGDGRTNSSDLVAALADGGYELGPPPAAIAAVPEPLAHCILLTALVLWAPIHRSRRWTDGNRLTP